MTLSRKKARSKGDQAYRFSLLIFAIGTLASAVFVTVWTWHSGIDAVRRGIEAAKSWLALWRLFLFIVLIGGWRHWIGWLARWAEMDERRYRRALALRWRTAAWLLVIEALLVQNVAGEFIFNLMTWH